MRKGISPNGKIINVDAAIAAGLIDEDQGQEMNRRYEKMPKTQVDVIMEHFTSLKDHFENFYNGLLSEEKFVQAVNTETIGFVSSRFGIKIPR